jgi:hypothetical protein
MDDKKNSRFIPGIYNYCDRWCERCAFTHRCRNFVMREDDGLSHEERSEKNDAFWQQLERASEASAEDWKDAETDPEEDENVGAEEVEFTEEELEEAERDSERRDAKAKELGGPITQSAEAYTWKLRQFIEAHQELFRTPPDEIDPAVITAAGGDANAEADAVWLQDALEVINWHQFFITVKLMRAFHSLVREEEFPQDWPRDSDGTAKVALIGLDRSIAAWVVVRDMLPLYREESLDFIFRLKRLSTKVEAQFPNARAFVRPGFDER